jgi:hypothetical protein
VKLSVSLKVLAANIILVNQLNVKANVVKSVSLNSTLSFVTLVKVNVNKLKDKTQKTHAVIPTNVAVVLKIAQLSVLHQCVNLMIHV